MEAKKIVIKQLLDRGFSAGEIFQQLKCLGINKLFTYKTINRLLETNSCKNRARSNHHRLAHTKEHLKRIVKDTKKSSTFCKSIAAEENVNNRTVQVILNEDLGFRPYRKRKVQGLTKLQRIKKIQRYKKLIRWHSKNRHVTFPPYSGIPSFRP